jgi:hypothetical protein
MGLHRLAYRQEPLLIEGAAWSKLAARLKELMEKL